VACTAWRGRTWIVLSSNRDLFANRNELLHFEKDLAIAGGMFTLMLRGAGEYSIQAFARQRAEHESGWQWRFRAF
jgi:uncharacterized membrane protein YphA (DoxX/SURF4 family)